MTTVMFTLNPIVKKSAEVWWVWGEKGKIYVRKHLSTIRTCSFRL